jgi:hypothetical protein
MDCRMGFGKGGMQGRRDKISIREKSLAGVGVTLGFAQPLGNRGRAIGGRFPETMAAEQLIELKCRNCGSQLAPEDISTQLAVARCHHCNALFAIPGAGPRAIARPEVSLPKAFRLDRSGDTVRISRRWIGPLAFFLLFFAVIWNGFMIVWNTISLTTGMWLMSVFGMIHTGVGLFLIYYVLALFLNSTVILASPRELEVRIGPVPWKGNKRLPRDLVEQLFCKEKISRSKNGTSSSYSVEAVLNGNRRETLASGFNDSDHALFVEQEIERHLGITDLPVAGEHGR